MRRTSLAAVAQWIEYWPPKPRVVGSIPASRTKRTFATLRGGVFVGGKPMFLLAFQKSQLRRAPPLFACSREFQGLIEGCDGKLPKPQPLKRRKTYIWQGVERNAGSFVLVDAKRSAPARTAS